MFYFFIFTYFFISIFKIFHYGSYGTSYDHYLLALCILSYKNNDIFMELIKNKAKYEEQINTDGNNSSQFCLLKVL